MWSDFKVLPRVGNVEGSAKNAHHSILQILNEGVVKLKKPKNCT